MKVNFLSLLLMLSIPALGRADALSDAEASKNGTLLFQELGKLATGYGSIRYRFQQHHTPTGEGIVINGSTIPVSRLLDATIAAEGEKVHIDYSETEQAEKRLREGFLISDGRTIWKQMEKKNGVAMVTKEPVGYQEEIAKAMYGLRPELAARAEQQNSSCAETAHLFQPQFGASKPPHQVYSKFKGRDVSFLAVEDSGGEKLYHLNMPGAKNCPRIELWISRTGLPHKLIAYNPYDGFEKNIVVTQMFSAFDLRPQFSPEQFTFKERDPKVLLIDLAAGKKQIMETMENSFATPANKIFVSLFTDDPSAVKNLGGIGTVWFTYDFTLRFEADKLPPWRETLEKSAGKLDEQKTFFLEAFPKDAADLAHTESLEATEYHKDRHHRWVLQNLVSRTFYVKAWADE